MSGVRLVERNPPDKPVQTRSEKFLLGNSVELACVGCALASVLLWLVSLSLMDASELDNLGLVTILPASFWFALCFATVSFVLSLDGSDKWKFLRPLLLALLILILHATPPIVYETLRYSWAWKHIGIVDYIQRHGHPDRAAPFLAAYHNWPFFFWLSAKATGLFALSPLETAKLVRFYPVFSNLCFAGLVFFIYRRFTDDYRLVWTSIWVFVCANWVGQDYFSPQAFAYALYLMIIAISLGPLTPPRRGMPRGLSRRFFELRIALTRSVSRLAAVSTGSRIISVLAACLAILVMVGSHQLTPLILIVSLLSLSVLSGLSVGYAALAALAVVSWIVYPAAPFTAVALPEEIASLSRTLDGVTDKFIDTSAVDIDVAIVAWAGRSSTIGIAILAGMGWIRRIWHGGRDGVACALLLAPLPILFVTSYGGEAVFRIFLFCVPFLSFFAASLFFPTNVSGQGVVTRIALGTLMVAMAVGFLFANNGKDLQYRFTKDEVAGAHWLYQKSKPYTLLVEGARNYPSQFMNYENFQYVTLANERQDARQEILDDPARILSRWFEDERWSDGYIILTRSQKAYIEALRIMPEGAFDKLEYALLASAGFQLVFANADVRIFTPRRFIRSE
ncbi:MAG: hypothetical protein ABJQ71_18470 [Roseibium sp.]